MKLYRLIIAIIVTHLLSAAAFASDPGPYLTLGAGYMKVTDAKAFDPAGNAAITSEISYDAGYSVGGAIGYDLGVNTRVELEVAYRHSDTDSLSTTAISDKYESDISIWSLLANVFYDIELPHGFKPYLGGGVGVAFVDLKQGDLIRWGSQRLHGATNASSDTVFAYAVGGGVAYTVTPKVCIDAGYRYFATNDIDGSMPAPPVTFRREFASHIAQLALRYKF